jgi:hypothetical protein
LLTVLEIVTDPQQVERGEEQDGSDDRPGDCQDDATAARQWVTECALRRETNPRASRWPR